MKKITALLLSIMMAVSLAVPAFAAYEPGTDAQQWMDAHPQQVAQFKSDGMDAYIRENLWCDSLAQLAERSGITEEEAAAMVLALWAEEQASDQLWNDRVQDYEARHPGIRKQLQANAYQYFAQEYPWWDSPKEYMDAYEITEKELLDMLVEEQLYDLIEEEAYRQAILENKAAMGGVPGEIGVMLNGSYISFPDAVPKKAKGRVMVPCRALMEAMGGTVSFRRGVVSCTMGDTTVTLTPGSTLMTIQQGEETSRFTMDCAPYIQSNRTYVPVRFVCQALGYLVGWDKEYETVVVVDPVEAAEIIDADFTILNRAYVNSVPVLTPEQALSQTAQANLSYTAFDTLNGDQTLQASLSTQALVNEAAASGSMSITLSDSVVDLLLERSEMPVEEANQLRAALRQVNLDYIITAAGPAWFRSPLAALSGEGNADAWHGTYLTSLQSSDLFSGVAAVTVGQRIVEQAGKPNTVTFWSDLLEAGELAAEFYGDSCFTTSGGTDVLTMDAADLLSEYPSAAIGEYKECTLRLTVDSQGNYTCSIVAHTQPQYPGGASSRLTVDLSQTGGRSTANVDLHIANTGRLTLSATSSAQGTSQQPLTQPPAGDAVVGGPVFVQP